MNRLLRTRRPAAIEPSRTTLRDLTAEALAGIVQRPGRSILTMVGTVLGIGALVAVLGLTATAAGQISQAFTALDATTVTVNDAGAAQTTPDGANPPIDFPTDADQRISALTGVVHGGVYWTVPLANPSIGTSPDQASAAAGIGTQLPVYAASPGALQAMVPTVQTGTLYNTFHQQRAEHVAVLGQAAARLLGVTNLAAGPVVFIDNTAFTVVGIINDAQRLPENLLGIMIPSSTALQLYGPPAPSSAQVGGAHMLIQTRIGAADLIAREAPLALDPATPAKLQATAPPDPHSLRDAVNTDLAGLFLLLAAICLVIGAVGIANTTFVAVLERTGEIGLRRALGARPRHIAAQFLTESAALGTLGGLIGTSLGILTVLAVALDKHWTALINPATALPAPLIGTIVGLAAGLYPAARAARIEPLEALRR